MNIIKTLIEYHKMIPHPEGGHYVEVFKNKHVSHIYFLLEEHEYSHWHRITKNAGIQADIKTVTALGSYAMTAITAITTQNTTGVKSIIPINSREILNQIIFTSRDGDKFQKNEIGADNKFIFTIEKNTWFAMKSSGSYSLIGCTVAPAFEFKDLELAPKNWKLSTLLGIVE